MTGMTTTIKLAPELRDRLNAEARRQSTTVAQVIEGLLDDRARARRFADLDRAIRATPAALTDSWDDETAAWDATSGDGLDARPT